MDEMRMVMYCMTTGGVEIDEERSKPVGIFYFPM